MITSYLTKFRNAVKAGVALGLFVFAGNRFGVEQAQAAKTQQKDTTIYVVADQEPQFKGNMGEWISKNVTYPEKARTNQIEGRVFVMFTIEKDGSITQVAIARSVHPLLDEEAIRIVKRMPKWQPALLKGKPVRFSKIYPLSFKLQPAETAPFTFSQYLENLKKEEELLSQKIELTPEQHAERVKAIKTMYQAKLTQESEIIAKEKEMTPEQQAELSQKLQDQFGHDDKFYNILIDQFNRQKEDIPYLIKIQKELLKLKTSQANKLRDIYLKNINAKIDLLVSLGKYDFISKFVSAEWELQKLELDKVLKIQKLLGNKFHLYFENVVLQP